MCVCSVIASAQSAQTPAAPTLAPSPSLARDSRCFEIRTYYAAPGKLEDLHARFRNHTLRLFKKHGMQIIGFWGPTDKEKGSENTLVYILAYPDRAAREQAWKAFQADPEWQAVRKKSEENGRLVEKVDSVILMATDYSPLK
ncbi:MAG TPA: NIPSNAP family protein [Blastocatellia bacterium]|nr:NIPSNAP family protein [Blastocatellia bacterium]